MKKFLFWLVFVCAASAAWYHSFSVFSRSDPWFIAALAATSIDGLTAYSLYAIGSWTHNQRGAGFAGIALFAVISGIAQVIARQSGLGVELPDWLRWVSLYLVPISTTGAVVVLGSIHYYDRDGNGIPDFLERKQKNQQQFRGQQPQQRHPERYQPQTIPTEHPGEVRNVGERIMGPVEGDDEEFIPIRSPVNPTRVGPRPTNGSGQQSRFSQDIERPPSLPPETGEK